MPNPLNIPRDFLDLLEEFAGARVSYLVIGGYAVGYHDRPRTTKALDLLLEAGADNIARACQALSAFGAPASVLADLEAAAADEIVWLGQPPSRIDLLKEAPGTEFAVSYARRVCDTWDGVAVDIVGLDDLIAAKRAAGREQDVLDVKHLERARSQLSKA